MKYNILLVDDDTDNLESTKDLLQLYPEFEVEVIESGFEAIRRIRSGKKEFALIVMDYLMPEINGAEATRQIKKLNPRQQIIMYSADDSREALIECLMTKPEEFIDKDIEPEDFVEKVQKYCRIYDLKIRKIQNEHTPTDKETFLKEAGIIGRSDLMYELLFRARKIASSNQAVLIMGESGTGKELFAKAIHSFSPRKKNKFVAINGAAISKGLAESELFGHSRGAFTGAHKRREGFFQQANGGTLFIDEVAELDLEVQAKLLRVIQEKTLYTVGGEREEKVNVRVVAATKENLHELVEKKLFREDLYYRLSGFQLVLPPLRDRTEDIELLVAHFTNQYNKENDTNKAFSRDTLETFRNCVWTGNVRTLAMAVQNHLILSESEVVTSDQILSSVIQGNEMEIKTIEQFDQDHDHKKWKYITRLARTCKNKAELARKLGVKPNRLHYTLEALKKSLNTEDKLKFAR